jgi:hypothetical protein
MDQLPPLNRPDCPIKCLGIDPDGKTFWFLNDKAELVGLTVDELNWDCVKPLFTKPASLQWLHQHFPGNDVPDGAPWLA